MAAATDSGFFESRFSRTKSLLSSHTSIRPQPLLKRQSTPLLSHTSKISPPRPRRPSQCKRATRMISNTSPAKSAKSVKLGTQGSRPSLRSKASKKSGTILRAVPTTTTCATTALLSPLERDMATLPNHEILTNIGMSSTPEGQSFFHPSSHTPVPRVRRRSSRTTALSPIKAGIEMRYFASNTDLRDTIGTYKHGKIKWENQDQSSTRSRRPRIQVIIPNEQRNRPLPSTPFFTNSSIHVGSASAELAHSSDISPPSPSSRNITVRESMVSPLSSQQQPPVRPLAPAIMPQTSKPEPDTSKYGNNTSGSTSSDESHGEDGSSLSSKRSSVTSVEVPTPPPQQKSVNFLDQKNLVTAQLQPLAKQRIAVDNAREITKSETGSAETGPRVTFPVHHQRPRRYEPHPPIEEDAEFRPTCALRVPASKATLRCQPSAAPKPSTPSTRRRSITLDHRMMGVLNQAVKRSESKQSTSGPASPTLSEAENDLEQHLTSFTEDYPFKCDDLPPPKPTPIGHPPAVPRKSSKRDSQMVVNFRLSRVPGNHIASQMKRNRSIAKAKGLTLNIPVNAQRMTDDFFLSPIPLPPKATRRSITPSVAENVILRILESLETFNDLFATAVVNKGFYSVFKRHELELMQGTLRKMSPPAWEHREICYPGHDKFNKEELDSACPRPEYTPTSYLQSYSRDREAIATLKSLIMEKCQSFLRAEMAAALLSSEPMACARVDDALWRIWTFCKIFGSGKGREEDIVAQMDWLKGGELVHQSACTYSIITTDALDMNDALASAPECFAKGNEGGLTAEQLFDMTELWNCLGVLLQPFDGCTIQAREYGVYENTEVRGGDIDGEEMMLDEWFYYLLTLGLGPILELAEGCRQNDSAAFILAQKRGWMDWKPPVFGGTRRNFLKEAASRVYEDKIAVAYASSSTKEVQRQLSKQRIQRHITELRTRKNSNERLPVIRMSQERPMSEWEGVLNNLTRPRPAPGSNIVSHIPQLRSAAPTSALANELSASDLELPPSQTPPPPMRPRSPPRRIVAMPLLPSPPPSTVPSAPSVVEWDTRSVAPSIATRASMPAIEEHPAFRRETPPSLPPLDQHPAFAQYFPELECPNSGPSGPRSTGSSVPSLTDHTAFQQHPLQQEINQSDPAMNTADKAVYRIVEMGFTPEQARHALRMTDLGDGLRVDRAVELLLRGT